MANINSVMIDIERDVFAKPLGFASPRLLCLSVKENYEKMPPLKLVWSINAGQGSEGLSDRFRDQEKEAALELIKQGKILPTFTRHVQLGTVVRSIDHFDHVNWARDFQNEIVIVKLSNDGDQVLQLDENQQHAVDLIRSKLSKQLAWETAPITLSDDTEITPITTDRQVYLRDVRSHGLG